MIFLATWLIAVIAGIVHVSVRRLWGQARQRDAVLLLYQLGISFGLTGLIDFVGHVLQPVETAARIGWAASPHFQYELGTLELGVAVAAFLGLFVRNKHYWLGVVLAPCIFLALAGLNHLREALGGNLAPYNVGTIAPDILIPATMAWLLFRIFRQSPS